nr:hypothetical protein L204_01926 [Cryptococcus depauperatus CBS 7855]
MAMVGMPMLVLASPLENTPTSSPTSNSDTTSSSFNSDTKSSTLIPEATPSGIYSDKTSGPISNPNFPLSSCMGIHTGSGIDWFTTSLCALLRSNPDKVKDSIKIDKGSYDNAESAIFTVYDLNRKVNNVTVTYKKSQGINAYNLLKSWFAEGFAQAVISTGGSGVKDGNLRWDVDDGDDYLVEAGKLGLEYLTGIEAVKEDPVKDGKNWGMSSSEGELQAHKRVDDWMDKAYPNPATVLTNDKPAEGLKPNMYYTIAFRTIQNNTIQLWNTTNLVSPSNLYTTVTPENLKAKLNVGQPSQAEIISALTSQSAIPRTTPTIPFPSSSAPLLELTNVGLVDGLEEKANNRKLYRSRDGYGSVILRAGLGR